MYFPIWKEGARQVERLLGGRVCICVYKPERLILYLIVGSVVAWCDKVRYVDMICSRRGIVKALASILSAALLPIIGIAICILS